MIVLWWLVGIALVVLSSLLLFAGIKGKEGVIRIGLPPERQSEDVSGQPSGQPGEAPAEAMQRQPGEAPAEAAPADQRFNLPDLAIGAAGLAVGVAALIIFAI